MIFLKNEITCSRTHNWIAEVEYELCLKSIRGSKFYLDVS